MCFLNMEFSDALIFTDDHFIYLISSSFCAITNLQNVKNITYMYEIAFFLPRHDKLINQFFHFVLMQHNFVFVLMQVKKFKLH